MKTLFFLGLAVVLVAPRRPAKPDAPADPNAALAKAHGGKVFVRSQPFPVLSGAQLSAWLSENGGAHELSRKGKDAPWTVEVLAVFKKPSYKGPVTVQFSDKTDPKSMNDQTSLPNDDGGTVFRGTYALDPDRGFNVGHTYIARVGQILNKKFVPYASGELVLR
jgi:hypothetical protein